MRKACFQGNTIIILVEEKTSQPPTLIPTPMFIHDFNVNSHFT